MMEPNHSNSPDVQQIHEHQPAELLTQAFIKNYPVDAARKLESLPPEDATKIIALLSLNSKQRVWSLLTISSASVLIAHCSDALALELLSTMDAGPCANLLGSLEEEARQHYLALMPAALAAELKEMLEYPPNCAGKMMDSRVLTFNKTITVAEAMAQLHRFTSKMRRRVFVVDSELRLFGQIDLESLVVAEAQQTLEQIAKAITVTVFALDPKEEVADKLQKNAVEALPVINVQNQIIGVIRGANALDVIKEDMTADLQTMVGVSRDEQALSSSVFAFKKRQSWLQINLLTGFLAASIVGLFESTIAQFTALAVLMPIAAGQSGNTGAQALAVTMRGLTLREITTRHWLRVTLKEAGAGLMNGIAISITCGAGVYFWSQSSGLALVIAMAMVISMTIAGIAGALVPICLKKLGQDPAQSSSIILTTVTDIAGFMSFLGIAAALSSLLV